MDSCRVRSGWRRWSWALLLLIGANCGDGARRVELLQLTLTPSQLGSQGGTVQLQARVAVDGGPAQQVTARLTLGQQTVAFTPLNALGDVWEGALVVPANVSGQPISYTIRIVADGADAGSRALQVLATALAPVVRSVLVNPETLGFMGGAVIVRAVIDGQGAGIQRAEVRITGQGISTPIVRSLAAVGEGVYERLDVPIPPHPQPSGSQAVTYQLEVVAVAEGGTSGSATYTVRVNPPSTDDRPPAPPA